VQLTTLLVETLKSGKVTVSQNDVETLQVNVQDKKIDVNATDKNFIKEIISSARGAGGKGGVKESIQRSVRHVRAAIETRPLLKDVVEDLCKECVTVTVSYKGERAVTIGAEANSKLTRLVTGTKGIEINSPRKLIEMVV